MPRPRLLSFLFRGGPLGGGGGGGATSSPRRGSSEVLCLRLLKGSSKGFRELSIPFYRQRPRDTLLLYYTLQLPLPEVNCMEPVRPAGGVETSLPEEPAPAAQGCSAELFSPGLFFYFLLLLAVNKSGFKKGLGYCYGFGLSMVLEFQVGFMGGILG